jgi:hypothetical protein
MYSQRVSKNNRPANFTWGSGLHYVAMNLKKIHLLNFILFQFSILTRVECIKSLADSWCCFVRSHASYLGSPGFKCQSSDWLC